MPNTKSRTLVISRAVGTWTSCREVFAGHRVEGEPGGDFRNAPRAVGDDDELDHDQDREDDDADRIIAADDDVPERLDDLSGVAVEQNRTGARDVQREPEQRDD